MQPGVDFQHVILTRFNLATPGRSSTFRNRDGWLERRFELFERHCLPSVAAQTCRDFNWLIYFDEATPEPFRKRLETLREIFPFTPVFSGLFLSEGWPRTVREILGARTEVLVSTRLDNDDGIARDFVARLHARLAAGADAGRFALNMPEGFVLQERRAYTIQHPSNAFATLVEPFDDTATTVAAIPHMELARHCPIVQLPGPGAWLQVIHGENISNKVRGRRVGAEQVRGRFPDQVLGQLDHAHPVLVAAENGCLRPIRGLRDTLSTLRHRFAR